MPDVLDQIVFADHPFPIPDQIMQKIENLRLNINQLGPAPQFLALNIEGVVRELVDQMDPLKRASKDILSDKSGQNQR
jgi:hypothetical protein